jgi:hypothetical protein
MAHLLPDGNWTDPAMNAGAGIAPQNLGYADFGAQIAPQNLGYADFGAQIAPQNLGYASDMSGVSGGAPTWLYLAAGIAAGFVIKNMAGGSTRSRRHANGRRRKNGRRYRNCCK